MNKRAFLALILAFGFFSNVLMSASSLARSAHIDYDHYLEAGLDLGVINRRMSFVYDFFDQSADVQSNLSNYQESLCSIVLVPMYQKCNGRYQKMISLIKKEIKHVKSVLKRVKKIEIQDQQIVGKLTKRSAQLNSLLFFSSPKHSIVRSLWSSITIDMRYGSLIKAYKTLPRDSNLTPISNESFEKELLYISFKNISRRFRLYPTAYFVDKCLSKDLKKFKKQSLKSFNKGYDTSFIEPKYNDLIQLKAAIEKMDFYLQDKRGRSGYRKLVATSLLGFYSYYIALILLL
jgi:hypothetical protein